jgi:hypothetical protein
MILAIIPIVPRGHRGAIMRRTGHHPSSPTDARYPVVALTAGVTAALGIGGLLFGVLGAPVWLAGAAAGLTAFYLRSSIK